MRNYKSQSSLARKFLIISCFSLIVLSGVFIQSQVSAVEATPSITWFYFSDWDANAHDASLWWAGALRVVNWQSQNFGTAIKKVGFYICSPDQTNLCSAWGDPVVATSTTGGSIAKTLGNPDGRLYGRLENNETPVSSYYRREASAQGNKYLAIAKACPLDSSNNIVGNCYSTNLQVLPPRGFNDGWSSWGYCSATGISCDVTGTKTRTCLATSCSGSNQESCFSSSCKRLASLDISSFNETTEYWQAGQTKTITWATTGDVPRVVIKIIPFGFIGVAPYYREVDNSNMAQVTLPSTYTWTNGDLKISGAGTMSAPEISLSFKATSAGGVWSDWSTCSATVCGTSGTQTRTCTTGTCSGPVSQSCSAAACTADPKIMNVAVQGISGSIWPAGATKTMSFDYRNFSAGSREVVVDVCHPTSTACSRFDTSTLSFASGNGSQTISKNLGNVDGRLYTRLTNSEMPVSTYYEKTIISGINYYKFRLRICTTNYGYCGENMFYVGPPVATTTPPTTPPTATTTPPIATTTPPMVTGPVISTIHVFGVYEGNINNWPAGVFKQISWTHNFFTDTVKTVSISLCNPTTIRKAGEKCLTWKEGDTLISAADSPVERKIGPLVYSKLSSVPPDPSLSPYFNNFQAVVRICPTNSSGVNVGSYANCAYSAVFTVTDPNFSGSPTYDLPSGQGCFVGECVCVNGIKMKCGNPMQYYSGCTGTVSCSAPVTSMAEKLVASVLSIGNWFISILK